MKRNRDRGSDNLNCATSSTSAKRKVLTSIIVKPVPGTLRGIKQSLGNALNSVFNLCANVLAMESESNVQFVDIRDVMVYAKEEFTQKLDRIVQEGIGGQAIAEAVQREVRNININSN